MKKIFIAIIGIMCLTSCSTLQDFAKVNSPKDGVNVTYNAKKGTFSAKYKVNKYFTLKY